MKRKGGGREGGREGMGREGGGTEGDMECVEVPVMTILLSAKHHTCPSWYLASTGCCGGRGRL